MEGLETLEREGTGLRRRDARKMTRAEKGLGVAEDGFKWRLSRAPPPRWPAAVASGEPEESVQPREREAQGAG